MHNLNKLNKFLKDKLIYIFLVTLFIIKLVPFYYFPIPSRLFSSHTLAKFMLGVIFLTILITNFKKLAGLIKKYNIVFGLILLFFLGQSFSVISASDVILFWRGYHNIIAALMIFVITFYLLMIRRGNSRLVSRFIIISGIILVFLELIYVLFANQLIPILKTVVQKEAAEAYLTNMDRGRYSLDMNIELFVPVFIVLIMNIKKIPNKFHYLIYAIVAMLVFITFRSNYRTRVVDLLFSILAITSIIIYKKRKRLGLLKLDIKTLATASFFILGILVSIISSNFLFGFNIFDRFALQHEQEDVATLEFRKSAAEKSVELYASSPLFGVGLGNYALFSERTLAQFSFYLIGEKSRLTYAQLGEYSPHNVLFRTLSETGALGIITYLILLTFFATSDYRYIRKTKKTLFLDAYIVSFWTIFVFMLFNPSYSIYMMGWFWFIRAIIEASYAKGVSYSNY